MLISPRPKPSGSGEGDGYGPMMSPPGLLTTMPNTPEAAGELLPHEDRATIKAPSSARARAAGIGLIGPSLPGVDHSRRVCMELTRFCGHLSIGDFSPRKGSPHGKDEAAIYAGVPL